MNQTQTTDAQETIRSSMEQLIAAMCEKPAELNVRLVSSPRRPALVVTCHRVDYGAILGKHRTMLNHLQLLAAHLGQRHGLAVTLSLDEEGCTGQPSPRSKAVTDPNWDGEEFMKLATLFCNELFPCRADLESVMTGSSKVTITTEETVSDLPTLEKALEAVFNCIGVVQGQRIMAEIVTM